MQPKKTLYFCVVLCGMFPVQDNLEKSHLYTIPKLFCYTSLVQMRFYLHMSGDGIGTLNVFRKSKGSLHRLLNVTGDQGNYWQIKEIPLSDTGDFEVMFEGKVGRSPKGDICLDDITFSPGCLLASSAGVEDTPPPPAGTLLFLLCYLCAKLVYFFFLWSDLVPLLLPDPPCTHNKNKVKNCFCCYFLGQISLVLISRLLSITLYPNVIYYNPPLGFKCLYQSSGTKCHFVKLDLCICVVSMSEPPQKCDCMSQ